MDSAESALRAIKDRIAAALGEIEESGVDASNKLNHRRLANVAHELHRCADEMQNVLMRIRPRQ